MNEEEKVIVKLTKQPLASERAEIRAQKQKKILIVLLCLFFLAVGIGAGYGLSFIKKNKRYVSHSNNKFDELKDYLENVWLYNKDYEDLDQELEDKAFYGMTYFADDPYTTYMSADELESFSSGINMNIVGIGVQYTDHGGIMQITRVFKNSAAEKAGLCVGDIFKKIDDTEVEGLTSDELKALVVGEAGTPVRITVLRGSELVEVLAYRASFDSTVFVEAEDDYLIMDLMSFGMNTSKECIKYLDDYKDYHKIIVDLRGNTGGYETSVQKVAGLFMGDGVVFMKQTYNNGQTDEIRTVAEEYYDNFDRIVILIDENTASAAEVFALALSEWSDNVTLVGLTSFGKGVVQSTYSLKDGTVIKLTTSAWTSQNDTSIHKVGVKPDVEVRLADIYYCSYTDMKDDESYVIDSVSDKVRVSQLALLALGHQIQRTDGYFDESFERSLNEFKLNNDLSADGVLDSHTYQTIISCVSYALSVDEMMDTQMLKAKELIRG